MMKSIFKSNATMPRDAAEPRPMLLPSDLSQQRSDAPVRVVMTPAEERALRMSNYPRYDAMDVTHAPRSRRGHDY